MNSQDSPRPRLGGSHHLPPYSILYNSPRGPHPNDILSRDSQVGVPKFPQLGLPKLWGRIILHASLRLWWGPKKSCSPCQELSNDMSHAPFTPENRVNSRLLVVGNQIVNLTPDLSFNHNLCFRCPNGWCNNSPNRWVLTLAIAHWRFGSPFGTPIFTMGVHLGVWRFIPSHSLHSLHSWEHVMWLLGLPLGLQPCNLLALVVSPRLGLQHWGFTF